MSNIIPIRLSAKTIQTITLIDNITYQIVDELGNPITQLHSEIVDGTLKISIPNDPNSPVLTLRNYENANFSIPNDAVITGDYTDAFIKAEEIVKPQVSSEDDNNYKLLWWGVGGATLVGLAALAAGGSKKGNSTPAQPAPNAKFDNLTEDNILNAEEAQSTITISGEMSNMPENAKLQLLVNNTVIADNIAVNDNKFSVNVQGSQLDQATSLTLKTLSNDGKTLATHYLDYQVDTSINTPNVEITHITEDNIINLVESKTTVNVVINVSNLDRDATAQISLIDNGNIVGTADVTANGKVNIAVDSSKLSSGNLQAVIQAVDNAGNIAKNETSKTYHIDTHINTPKIEINTIADDNLINRAESQNKKLPVKLTISNLDSDSSAVVTLTNGKKNVGTVNVNKNGEVTAYIDGTALSGNTLIASIKATDKAGNTTATNSASKNFTFDADLNKPTISSIKVTDDNVITAAEQQGAVEISATVGNLDSDLTKQTIKFYDGLTLLGSKNAVAGKNTLTVENGASLTAKNIRVVVDVEDKAGNSESSESNQAYQLKTDVVTPTITINSVAENNIINIAKSKTVQNIVVSVKDLEDGTTATINLIENDKVIATQTSITQNGNVTINVAGDKLTTGSIKAEITASDRFGQTVTANSNEYAYTLDLAITQPSIEINTIADDNLINRAESQNKKLPVKLTISNLDSDSSAVVTLTNGQKVVGTANVNKNGEVTAYIDGTALSSTQLNATIQATDKAGNTASNTANKTFVLDTAFPSPTVEIVSIADNNIINQAKSQLEQTILVKVSNMNATATTEIILKDGNNVLGTLKPSENGTLSLNVAGNKLTSGQVSAEVRTTADDGEEQSQTVNKAYQYDVSVNQPTITDILVTDDNIITKAEQNSSVKITANVNNLDSDVATQTIKFYDGDTLLGSQAAVSGVNTFTLAKGADLTAKTIRVVVDVQDKVGNTATAEQSQTYNIKNSVATPSVAINTVAENNIINQTKFQNPQKVAVTVSKLESGATATIKLLSDGKVVGEISGINKNGKVEIDVAKNLLNGGSIQAEITATDKFGHTATATSQPFDFTVDVDISQPKIEIVSIGVETELSPYQSLDEVVPVVVNVSQLDSDATGKLQLKTDNFTLLNNVQVSEGQNTIEVKMSDLLKGSKLQATVTAIDEAGNQATNSAQKDYDVENFIIIKQIDDDFSITFGDTRQAGLVISGEVELAAVLQEDYLQFQDGLNQGDVWRWIDSVTLEFENGASYTVPVTHIDNDNNPFTADDNLVQFALSLTASEWRELSEQAFRIVPNRLADRAGKPIATRFYLKNANNDGIFSENATRDGKLIQKLEMEVLPLDNDDVSQNNDVNFTYRLNKFEPKTYISGIAGGNDVQAGDTVAIKIGDHTYTTQLKDDKSFYIEVDSEVLLNNPTTTVTATLSTQSGVAVAPASAGYLSSQVTPNVDTGSSSTQTDNEGGAVLDTVGDVAREDLPYFINSLINSDKLRFGFVKGHTSGAAITIKYSFADPADATTVAYMQQQNPNITNTGHKYNIAQMEAFTAKNKQVVRDALAKISERTKITFVEQTEFLQDGEGMNFFMFPFYSTGVAGFASEGGNVRLNKTLFQTTTNTDAESISPINAGFKTVLHEIMHALGMKHPFKHSDDEDHNDHHVHDVDDIHVQEILTKAEDRALTTLMSYTSDINSFGDDLRPYDLATLHYRFGVNPTQRSGDDIYTFKTFNKRSVDGDIYIWDGAGKDTFNAANEQQSVYINLTPGSWIYSGEKAKTLIADGLESLTEKDYFNDENFTLKSSYLQDVFNRLYPNYQINSGQAFIGYGTVIENAVGSDFDDTIIGNDADNVLEGGKGNDRLEGGKGNDVLNGGLGDDVMIGGEGDDVYFVDSENDVVTENADEGKDTVYSTVSIEKYFDNVEVYHLLGSENLNVTLGPMVITLTSDPRPSTTVELYGNDGNNLLSAGDGNDILDGGAGIDKMWGGYGNDTYYVDHSDDEVIEVYTAGYDTVYVSISNYKLPEYVEKLVFTENAGNTKLTGSVNGNWGAPGNTISPYTSKDGVLAIDIEGNSANNHFELNMNYEVEKISSTPKISITGNEGTDSFILKTNINKTLDGLVSYDFRKTDITDMKIEFTNYAARGSDSISIGIEVGRGSQDVLTANSIEVRYGDRATTGNQKADNGVVPDEYYKAPSSTVLDKVADDRIAGSFTARIGDKVDLYLDGKKLASFEVTEEQPEITYVKSYYQTISPAFEIIDPENGEQLQFTLTLDTAGSIVRQNQYGLTLSAETEVIEDLVKTNSYIKDNALYAEVNVNYGTEEIQYTFNLVEFGKELPDNFSYSVNVL